MCKKHYLAMMLGVAFAGSMMAAETTEFVKEDFSGKLRCGKSGDSMKEMVQADGPAEGSKSMKLHFKVTKEGSGWPQVQYYPLKPFVPGKAFFVEFDMKCEHPGDYMKLRLEIVPFGKFQECSQIPFVDDNGKWQKIRLRFEPKAAEQKVETLCFTVANHHQKLGDETVFYIANLRVYSEK